MLKGQNEHLVFIIKDSNTDNFLSQVTQMPKKDGTIAGITSVSSGINDAIRLRSYEDCTQLVTTINGSWDIVPCRVIEYIETPRELLEARDENGELLFGDAHFGCNFFDVDLLSRIVSEKLPIHAALKKNKAIMANGEFEEINTYKFEAFIFDAFSMAKDILIFRVKRDEEFAPIKNKEGDESPETAIMLYKKFYGME